MDDLLPTPSQTVGPYFHLGCTRRGSVGDLAGPRTPGERIRLIFRVLDGEGAPIDDAMIELWQADAGGSYYQREEDENGSQPAAAEFRGFGRLGTGSDGICIFNTIRPGRVAGEAECAPAPHINVSIFARGLLNRLTTRVYFAGDPANAHDPILALVPELRRGTLLACPCPEQPGDWHIEIRLCGERETVFFDV